MKRTLLVILISWFTAFNGQARTIPVRSAAEIKSYLPTLQPGDTLLMQNGYWKNQQIEFKAQGAENQPIVLKAETPGKVWLTGQSNLRIGGQFAVVDGLYFVKGYSPQGAVVEFRDNTHQPAYHCRLTNSAIVDFNPPSKDTDYKWISLYGQYNRVDHCYFAGKNHSGTTLVVWLSTQPNYHQIDHNHFGPRPELGKNGAETIRIGTSDYSMYDSYTTVEWNYFEHCDGELEVISNKSCRNVYRYNTFDECKGTLTLRHGNACEVYANFFFGKHNTQSGGVRIIGEDHRVYNNYFQDLNGTGFRAALSLVNGVPNSPLNRYFQVKRAQVVFNTVVHCYQPLVIGAGADEERTLPPLDCVIANNVVQSPYYQSIVTFEAQPINLTWLGNVFFGPEIGVQNEPGITVADPLLVLADDGLYRPQTGSPLIGAAQDTFAFVRFDMDGQTRTWPKDVGADQMSTQAKSVFPLQPGDVGPDWYPPQPPPVPVIRVQQGVDSLKAALQKAEEGDIVELVSEGGIYSFSSPVAIDKNITIRAAAELTALPILQPATEVDSLSCLFYWQKGRRLNLQRLVIDGQHCVSFIFKNETQHASLAGDSLVIKNSAQDSSGAVFWAARGSLMDTLDFHNVSFFHGRGRGIVANQEAEGSAQFNINVLKMNNCTVWDFDYGFVEIYGGDDVPFTPAPQIRINHCTFYQVATVGGILLNAREADFTTVKNSIFCLSNEQQPVLALYGQTAQVDFCDFFQTGPLELKRNASAGSHLWFVDPLFKDAANGDFGLQPNSYLWGKADDGYPLGDLRWTGKVLLISEPKNGQMVPRGLRIKNFPNPFNGQTTIQIQTGRSGMLRFAIVDAQGRCVGRGQQLLKANQPFKWLWQANHLASGVYFFRAQFNGQVVVKKLLLMR